MVFKRILDALERIERKQDRLNACVDALAERIGAGPDEDDARALEDKRLQQGIHSILGYQPGRGRER